MQKESQQEQQKVVVDKELLMKKLDSFESIHDVEVPEFQKDGERIPIFKVRKASLDDQINARELSTKPVMALGRIAKAVKDGKQIDSEFIQSVMLQRLPVNEKTLMEINLFSNNVLEPKFTVEDALKLSKSHPKLVNRICFFILDTEG